MFLDSLQHQLKIPPEESLASAERILDAKLQCSLGGQYVIVPNRTSTQNELWESTAWPKQLNMMSGKASALGFDSTQSLPPVAYLAPWLQWFRGAELHLTQLPERLIVVGTIDIEPLPAGPEESVPDKSGGSVLPKMDLDLFSMPFKFFQGDKPKGDKDTEKKPAETRKSF